MRTIVIAIAAAAAACGSLPAAAAGVDKLYVLDCGHISATDQSRWSPGVNVGVPIELSDNCYLIHHAQGWFLWDTGLPDALAALPDGAKDPNTGFVTKRAKTLASELDALGVKASDIKAMAISHTHPDHVGNVEEFPQAMLYVQKAEYDWPNANGTPRFKPEHPVTKLEGDHDVFGDGSVVIISTPGHTPGHQSLFVRLAKTGPLVLSGDLYHYPAERTLKDFLPFAARGDDAKEASSKDEVEALLKDKGATLWIQHDLEADAKLKKSPAYYD